MLPSNPCTVIFCSSSVPFNGLNIAVDPSESITDISWTWSTVLPYIMECEPQELLPIAPPTFAREDVLGSGVKCNVVCASCRFSSSIVIPGCVLTHFSSVFISKMLCMYFEKSMTMPVFTVCPERLVPPPRGSMLMLFLAQVSMVADTSSALRGMTTPAGVILYIDASVEYMFRE